MEQVLSYNTKNTYVTILWQEYRWHDKVTTPTHSSKFSDDTARLKDEIE